MKYLITLLFLLVLFFPVNDLAQSRAKSAVGIFYSTISGNHGGEYCLNVNGKLLCLGWDDATKMIGREFFYGSSLDGYDNGAIWSILYSETPRQGDELPYLIRATFTGRIDPSIAGAQGVADKYVDEIIHKQFEQAYSRLSPSAHQRISFNEFVNTNRNVDDSSKGSICSHSESLVVLIIYLHAYGRADGTDKIRRVEIVNINGEWYIDRFTNIAGYGDDCAGVKLQPTTSIKPATAATTALGYIDVVENSGSGCRIRVIAGDRVYTGVVSFSRLSVLVKRRITSYQEALASLDGKQISITLSGIDSSCSNNSTCSFTGIGQLTTISQNGRDEINQRLPERTTATETIIDLSTDILFDFNQSTINAKAVPSLIKLARLLRNSANKLIQLNGFTDSIGSNDYNLDLSQRRAAAVKQWLVSKGGIDARRLMTNGYGKDQPVAPNTNADGSDSPTGRQKNRRVEVRIPKS